MANAKTLITMLGLTSALLACDGSIDHSDGNSVRSSVAEDRLPTISVDRFSSESGRTEAFVRITNSVEPKGYRLVGIRCTFLKQGIAVDDTGSVATNVAYRQTVFETLIGPYTEQAVDQVKCRVSYANV